jgi:single-strand DNA-binding protein
MASYNKVILIGNLVDNPELKTTPSGVSVANFKIAISRRIKKEGQPDADFVRITAWRGTAEFVSKYFEKGRSILVAGELRSRSWTDTNGQKRFELEVEADEIRFVDKKPDTQNTTESVTPAQIPEFTELPSDEDLPF